MSYPTSLDEYDEEQLAAEIKRRKQKQRKGICDYCDRESSTPACRFPLDTSTSRRPSRSARSGTQ